MRTQDSTTSMKFAWLAVFAVAMGFLEAIVVVYLRQIYYPQGFEFPLVLLSPELMTVELIREAATLIMLAAVGIIAGRNNLQRLLYFLFSFAVWDILYYVALKIFLGWPPSLMTWDLLFLIPITWIGPVLAPVICSLTMILMAVVLIPLQERSVSFRTSFSQWALVFLGAFMILYTYLIDFTRLFKDSGILSGDRTPAEEDNLKMMITQFIPTSYNWLLFAAGELIILAGVALMIIKNNNKNQP